jgi:hypothetical protein
MKKLTIVEITDWLKKYNIHNYEINSDLTVSVKNSVDLGKAKLTHIPIKFKYVDGYFTCADNSLSNLEFCPDVITSFLDVSSNKLTNLKGVSKTIGTNLICHDNFITTLMYAPEEVGKSILCNFNLVDSVDNLLTRFKDSFITCYRDNENHRIQGLENFYKFNDRLILTSEDLKKYQLKLQLESNLFFKMPNELIKI